MVQQGTQLHAVAESVPLVVCKLHCCCTAGSCCCCEVGKPAATGQRAATESTCHAITQQEAKTPVAASYAEAVRQVVSDLGPLWVKLGQTMSVRPDVFGHDLAAALSGLQVGRTVQHVVA